VIRRALARLRSLWWNLVRRDRAEQGLDDELRAYVHLLAAEYEEKGMAPDEARRAALVATGGVEQVKESIRDAWAGNTLATVFRELRYALRTLRRSPAFLAIAITTLALGIGGATAVFTVIKGSLLRPLPGVADPERLVTVERVQPTITVAEFSVPDARDLNEHTTALSGLAGFNGTSMSIQDSAGSDRVWVSFVTHNFFEVMGVRAARGRLFGSVGRGATTGESDQVVVLAHALWRSRYGGSPSVIGSTVELNDHTYTVIGVTPPGFVGGMAIYPMEMFIPLGAGSRASPALGDVDLVTRRYGLLRLVGRLAPGKGVEDAQRDLARIAAQLEAEYAMNRGRSVQVLPRVGMTAEERVQMSRVPRLLAMGVALLLLIACGNVATLSLIRSSARRRELATRLALGASRAALVRQVALEGVVIAAGAGLLGVLLAGLLVESATLVNTVVSMQGLNLQMDRRVLAVALAASTLTAVLVSLMPAVRTWRVPAGAVLKDGGGAVRRRSAGQRTLVAAQVGASLVLLAAAAMVFTSFNRALAVHDGFDPRGLTDARLEANASPSDTARQLAFYQAVLARARSDAGVEAAALTTTVPPFQWATRATVFRRGEEPPPHALAGRELELGVRVLAVTVSADFFTVMRIPLLGGRAFTDGDDARVEPVAIVSNGLAEALWPGRNPLGQYVAWPVVEGPPRAPVRVVGVVADTRDVELGGESPLAMYVPYAQHPGSYVLLLLRGRGGTAVSEPALRRIVAAVDPNAVVMGGRTLDDRLRAEVRPQRTASAWIGVFGGIAMLLACIGLYGVVAQGVLQRTRELAVRSAIGATPRSILATVLGDGMRLAAIGGMLGAIGVVASLRVVRSMFVGVGTVDLVSASKVVGVLALAVLVASYLPARRAARLNPMDALRSE
jgi:predicted permease